VGPAFGYDHNVWYGPRTKTVPVTCDGSNLIATASGWTHDDFNTLVCPVSTVTITVPIESSTAQTCAAPCPIPSKNLTLTRGSDSGTLAFHAGDNPTWTGTVAGEDYTLAIVGGVATLTGGGLTGWTVQTLDSTCDPLHLEFKAGSDTAYVDE
jgi:hypothetical protein